MLKKQRGASSLSLIFSIVLGVLFLKIVLSLVPAYWDDHVINQQIKSVLSEKHNSKSEVTAEINKRLDMNDIGSLKFEDIAKISDSNGTIIVSKQYEIRKHWLSNIDLVLTFEKSFDQRTIQVK